MVEDKDFGGLDLVLANLDLVDRLETVVFQVRGECAADKSVQIVLSVSQSRHLIECYNAYRKLARPKLFEELIEKILSMSHSRLEEVRGKERIWKLSNVAKRPKAYRVFMTSHKKINGNVVRLLDRSFSSPDIVTALKEAYEWCLNN